MINDEERQVLRELCQSDKWELLMKISEDFIDTVKEQLMALREGDNFHFTQGQAVGVRNFMNMIKKFSIMTEEEVVKMASEMDLFAKSKK